MIDPVDLLAALIACPSVTPADAGAQDVLARALGDIGFSVERFVDGEAPHGPVHNLLAWRGQGVPHLAFAGHSDVVPPGPGWTAEPFTPTMVHGAMAGRGAVDMKGAIAAFVAAASSQAHARGTLSLLITGDEEGPAVHGTMALMEHMEARRLRPDYILVGEPTSSAHLGDTVKIGRRGSVNVWIEVPGVQGHVAYPHLASNPIPALARLVARLSTLELDRGTDWFQPSNLEVTDLHVGNDAHNIVPGSAQARLNIRFNDRHQGAALIEQVRAVAREECPEARVVGTVSGEAFLTAPGRWSSLVAAAISDVTGLTPALSTSGGTSDARFLSRLAPTVEFGLVNATMHKVDEAVPISDLHELTRIYEGLIRRVFAEE